MPSAAPLITPAFRLVWLGNFLVFAAFGAVLLGVPIYARDELAASDLAVGVAVGVASITAIVFGPVSGRLADRHGRRVVLILGALAMIVGYLGLALEPPLAALLAVRLVGGVGEAAFIVGAFTMITDLAPHERRGEAISLLTVGSYGGLALGPVLGTFVLGGDRFALLWLAAAAAVVLAAAAAVATPETRPNTDVAGPRGWLPPRPALLPGALMMLVLLGFGGFNAFAVLYAREVGLSRPGVVFAVFGVIVLLVRGLERKLPDRLGGVRAAGLACVCVALGLAVMGVWQSEAGVLLGTAVSAVGQSLAYPAIALLALERADAAERSAVLGSVSAFIDVALSVGAFTLGAVAELAGYGGAFVVAAAVAASGLLLLARLRAAPQPLAAAPASD